MRASDADRDAVAGLLSSALAEGRLTAREHAERVEAAYAARTAGDLGTLTADLPGPTASPAGREPDVLGGRADRCLLCALLVLCPPAGIAWLLAARRRARAASGPVPAPQVPRIAEAARAARRDQIITAGLACFARSGYHAATMADVAATAGVSKGTPYLYFDSKQALFLALHERWDCGAGQRIGAAVAALGGRERESPRAVLGAVAAAVAAHVLAESQACRVLMEARALAAREPVIAAAILAADTRMHQQLQELFTAGVEAGEWPAGTDPALAARLFTAGMHGLMAQWHLAPGSFSWPAAAAALAASSAPGGTGDGRAREPATSPAAAR